jgi:hypothetical protein
MGTELVLNDVPLNLDDVHLGSLVPNINYPHQDALIARAATASDYTARKRKLVTTRLDSKKSHSLTAYLTKLLSVEHGGAGEKHLDLSALEGVVYELRQPKKWFQELCAMPEVRMWLEAGINEGLESYFITGIRTLKDARVERRGQASARTKVEGKAPIGEAMGVPRPVGDKAEAGISASHTTESEKVDVGEMEGERIYAVCFRRVKYKWYKKSSVDSAFLESTNTWVPISDDTRGDEEKLLEVDIFDVDEVSVAIAPEEMELKIAEEGEVDYLQSE